LGGITKGVDSARPHFAVGAAKAQLAITTLGLLAFKAFPCGLYTPFDSPCHYFKAGLINSSFSGNIPGRFFHWVSPHLLY
jgi:hypothetical protein